MLQNCYNQFDLLGNSAPKRDIGIAAKTNKTEAKTKPIHHAPTHRGSSEVIRTLKIKIDIRGKFDLGRKIDENRPTQEGKSTQEEKSTYERKWTKTEMERKINFVQNFHIDFGSVWS